MTDEEEPSSNTYDRIITVVYVLAIGFYVYMYLDTATDGRLSQQTGLYLRRATYSVRDSWKKRQEYKKAVGQVLWQAFTITEEAANDL